MGAKKIAIASVASLLLVACVIAAVVTFTKKNEDNNNNISTSSKSVQVICQPTDYKETCEESLADANHINDPKELMKVAFNATMHDLSNVIKNSESLAGEASKDHRAKDALHLCKSLLDVSIDDLRRSFDRVDTVNDPTKMKDHSDELKTWLSAAITFQQTCLDEFANTSGDTGRKMKELLKNAGELTSNGLAMVSSFGEILTGLNVQGAKRRLLNAPNDENYELGAYRKSPHRRLMQVPASNPPVTPNAVVATDGSGQFRTINEALSVVPKKNNQKFVIFVKAGVYNEQVIIPRKMNNIVLIGEGPTVTKITNNLNFIDGVGTFKTATVAVNADNFMAKDIGFENTAGPLKHQAVALRVSGDMAVFHNCQIDGYQDTLYVHSYRQFYRDCTISGTIDFIFGDGSAVFQNCKMVIRKPMDSQSCMVTAQGRTDRRSQGAIVIQSSQITVEPDFLAAQPPIQAYLGRPWKEFSRTIIMLSTIDGFINPLGWHPWNGTFALDTLYYAEFQNTGLGANTAGRVNWLGYHKDISPQEAAAYTPGFYIQADQWIKLSGVPYEAGLVLVRNNKS